MPTTLPAKNRLIFALDVPSAREAQQCVQDLEGVVTFFKVGLELFIASGTDLLKELQNRGCRIFLDLKMQDVDETIRRAVAAATAQGIDFLTIQGGAATNKAATLGKGDSKCQLLSVPLLSSFGEDDLRDLHLIGPSTDFQPRFSNLDEYVLWRAGEALHTGCDGLIGSGEYVGKFRKAFPQALIVSPAIRPPGSSTDEHKRFLTPAEAIKAGADFLVVGRPIRDAKNRKETAQNIIRDMETAFS
jgi:orotidine-5'-phosphate decarboxylase